VDNVRIQRSVEQRQNMMMIIFRILKKNRVCKLADVLHILSTNSNNY
jgi:hypothetical protein